MGTYIFWFLQSLHRQLPTYHRLLHFSQVFPFSRFSILAVISIQEEKNWSSIILEKIWAYRMEESRMIPVSSLPLLNMQLDLFSSLNHTKFTKKRRKQTEYKMSGI